MNNDQNQDQYRTIYHYGKYGDPYARHFQQQQHPKMRKRQQRERPEYVSPFMLLTLVAALLAFSLGGG